MQTGILLINLGTPIAPTTTAVRKYLRSFLSDHRVIEISRWIWLPLLYSLVLLFRPRLTAKKYQSIWTKRGSPLLFHTQDQARALEETLQKRHPSSSVTVKYAMRYSEPSIENALQELQSLGCQHIIALPLYPQYAASSTATALDCVYRSLQRMRNMPSLTAVKDFHTDQGYLDALEKHIRAYWSTHGKADHLLISFHGLPVRMVEKGDPYFDQCKNTALLLVQRLGLSETDYTVAFQSRFGTAQWLQPATNSSLITLAQRGIKNLHVICPGFVSDCLETLEEIAIEGKTVFEENGGNEYHYIPCLNENPDWINALADLCHHYIVKPYRQYTPPSRNRGRSTKNSVGK